MPVDDELARLEVRSGADDGQSWQRRGCLWEGRTD